MECVFEFILELVLEGSVEVTKSTSVPKYIRYPLIAIILLFFLAVIGVIFWTGIIALKYNAIVGISLILIGLVMSIMSVMKFKKVYLTKMKTNRCK